ncbi:cbb3-type cytochrome c oxidase subunit I [Cupriavidus basilensis]
MPFIFAFGGSALFATSYYIVQRTLPRHGCSAARWPRSRSGARQLVIVAAAITLPMGFTSSKEYAELEWPIDILITLVWVAYAIVFFGTIMKRKTRPYLCGQLVLRRLHPDHRHIAHRQQRRDAGDDVEVLPRPMPACRTPWCSGGSGRPNAVGFS